MGKLLAGALLIFTLQGAVPAEQYRARRTELRKALPDAVTVLFGRTEKDSDDLRSSFFQEPNFYYLTGWREPGAILLLTPAKEILFLPKRIPAEEKWTGRKAGPDDPNIREDTGFDSVLPAEVFETEFRRELDAYPRIYALTERPTAKALATIAPLRPVAGAAIEIAHLRMNKSPEEIALIEKATDVTLAAHRAAWKRAAAGLYEYQIAATMTDVYFESGCERSAYAPIVGSGPNSVLLHYSRNTRRMG
ncbi:MAG: aminopeptidase P N-terminal domain-containing protein [Bryobacteraceae bacterium]